MRMSALEEYNQHRRKLKAKKALGFSKFQQVGKPEKTIKGTKKRKPIKKVSKKQLKELAKRAKLKAELIEESGGLCQICGKEPGGLGLSLSHTIPLSRGGKTEFSNLKVLCHKCHSLRHNIKEM